jgi:hypothetical protein
MNMNDLLAIVGIAAMIGIVAVMALGLRWFLGDRGDTWTFVDMQRATSAHGWPVGVQEEEPFRWQVEALANSRRGPVGKVDRTSPRGAQSSNQPRTALG